MTGNEYKITGEVSYNYGLIVIDNKGNGFPMRIVEFDIRTDVWSNISNSYEKTELHFWAGGGLTEDARILKPGDKVEIRFVIEGVFKKGERRGLFNRLRVRSMRINKDYEFDIDEWREEQRRLMSESNQLKETEHE